MNPEVRRVMDVIRQARHDSGLPRPTHLDANMMHFLAQAIVKDQGPHVETIRLEREKQDAKWGTVGDRMISDELFLVINMEEFGEVARAMLEHDPDEHLEEEIVQCIAVFTAWLDTLALRRELITISKIER